MRVTIHTGVDGVDVAHKSGCGHERATRRVGNLTRCSAIGDRGNRREVATEWYLDQIHEGSLSRDEAFEHMEYAECLRDLPDGPIPERARLSPAQAAAVEKSPWEEAVFWAELEVRQATDVLLDHLARAERALAGAREKLNNGHSLGRAGILRVDGLDLDLASQHYELAHASLHALRNYAARAEVE